MADGHMRTRFIALGLVFGAALGLAGCAATPEQQRQQDSYNSTIVQEFQKKLDDGRTVTCIIYPQAGGLSCDWESLAFPKE